MKISGLTVEHGDVSTGKESGGEIDDLGTLTVSQSVIEDNTAVELGGGINSEGTLSVIDTTVTDNTAGSGAGIANDGNLTTLSDSVVSDNSGTGGPGAGLINDGNMTITNSTISGNLDGGGIDTGGSLTITDSTLSGNSSPDHGGGLTVDSEGGFLRLTDSTVSDNSSDFGGGIADYGDSIVLDSTISDNTAHDNGGGITSQGGEAITVEDSTISGNTAPANAGGGIWDDMDSDSDVSLLGTIVANSPSGGACSGYLVGIHDAGYNIDDDGTCDFSAAKHSISDEDPDLGPLSDNGGLTETQAPASSSPVLNQMPPGTTGDGIPLCPSNDQRGVARPQVGSDCDIGSYEYGDVATQSLTTSASKLPPGSTLTYAATLVNAGSSGATGVALNDTIPSGEKFKSASTTLGSCSQSSGTVTCTIGDMDAASTATIDIVVKIIASSGTIKDTATVSATTGDTISGNDSRTTKVKVT